MGFLFLVRLMGLTRHFHNFKAAMPFFLLLILLCVGIQCIKSMIASVFLCNKPATMLPVIALSDVHDEPSWDFDFEGLFEDEEETLDL